MLAKVPAAAPVPNSVERGLRTGPAVPPEAYPSWTVNAYDLELEGMGRLFDEWSLPAYRAQQVFAGLWARADTYELTTGIAKKLGGAYGLGITDAKTMFGTSEGH